MTLIFSNFQVYSCKDNHLEAMLFKPVSRKKTETMYTIQPETVKIVLKNILSIVPQPRPTTDIQYSEGAPNTDQMYAAIWQFQKNVSQE